jgi:ubiquinone biosynthesis protein COQ9
MAQPIHVPQSIAELGKLADEIWFLVGDTSVDTSWYTKRGTLAALYASAEVYQTQDSSPEFIDTERFIDDRLRNLKTIEDSVSSVSEWAGFTGHSVINVLRSKGLRI